MAAFNEDVIAIALKFLLTTPSVPDGYVLVPVVATKEMKIAGMNAHHFADERQMLKDSPFQWRTHRAEHVYNEMIAARPGGER